MSRIFKKIKIFLFGYKVQYPQIIVGTKRKLTKYQKILMGICEKPRKIKFKDLTDWQKMVYMGRKDLPVIYDIEFWDIKVI